MASFRGHLAAGSLLGAAYSGMALARGEVPWTPALLGAGLSAVGGLLPDLDSDASVPHRSMFRLAGAGAIVLASGRLAALHYSITAGALTLAAIYLSVRYVLGGLFRRLTVHRGMFHSIPALCISGLIVFLIALHYEVRVRAFLALGIMIGFLSHLVLDEICAVDFQGARLRKPFGTALKFFSASWNATAFCYALLFVLALLSLQSL